MACIFMDGFDFYQGWSAQGNSTLLGDLGKRWSGINGAGNSGAYTVGAAYARAPSGQGLYAVSAANTRQCLYKAFGVNPASGCFGVAVQFIAATTTRILMTVYESLTEQISVRTNASGVLIVSRSGTTIATGSTVLTAGVWYYVELKYTIHNSAGVVELHLNGATEIASTASLNTRATANAYWNAIGLGDSASNSSFYYDDVYVLDTTTGSNTTFLGPVSVIARYPNAAGTHTDWTPNGGTNMGCVSEPFEDGDNSFNESSTANQIDSFAMQDLPAAAGSVLVVQTIVVARQDTGAARTLAPLLRIGATDYPGTTVSLSTSYQFLVQDYDLEPVGGTPAWSIADVNAMEVGVKLIS